MVVPPTGKDAERESILVETPLRTSRPRSPVRAERLLVRMAALRGLHAHVTFDGTFFRDAAAGIRWQGRGRVRLRRLDRLRHHRHGRGTDFDLGQRPRGRAAVGSLGTKVRSGRQSGGDIPRPRRHSRSELPAAQRQSWPGSLLLPDRSHRRSRAAVFHRQVQELASLRQWPAATRRQRLRSQ